MRIDWDDDEGYVEEGFFMSSMIFVTTMLISVAAFIFIFPTDPGPVEGVVMDKTHTQQEVSEEFTVGRAEEVVSEESFVLHLDTNDDGKPDKEYEVGSKAYVRYDKGEQYPGKEKTDG